MILIDNEQDTYTLNTQSLKQDIQTILSALDYADYDLGIKLINDEAITVYNKLYRKKDTPTDILSFPFHPQLQVGQRITPASDDDKNLGDIVISVEYVVTAAKQLGISVEQRLKRLLVHGICHLLGYDHESDDDYAIMLNKEKELLPLIGYLDEPT